MLKSALIFSFFFSLLIGFMSSCDSSARSLNEEKQRIILIDSLTFWYNQSQGENITIQEKLAFLERAKRHTSLKSNDSIYRLVLQSTSSSYSRLKDFDKAISETHELLRFSERIQDTAIIAKSYFKLGFYHSKKSENSLSYEHYRNALNLSLKMKDSLIAAKLFGNLSTIQNKFGDFLGAQQNAIKAIELTEDKAAPKLLFTLYNTFANACQNNMQLDEAHTAYKNAYRYASTFYEKTASQNNIALNHRKKKDYAKSNIIYEELIAAKELEEYPLLKARLLDNYGFNLFLDGKQESFNHLINGKNIRIAEKDLRGQLASNIHLIQYYLKKDQSKAIAVADEAYDIAKETQNIDAQLEVLRYLMELRNNPQNVIKTFHKLNDSLNLAKKLAQNKYAATLFLSEEKEKENLQLIAEKAEQTTLLERESKRNWLLAVGLIAALLGLLALTYFYRKNKKQKEAALQQKSIIEALQRELHHRIKNNLSFVDLFINLAKSKFDDPIYLAKLTELQNRINSMFKVHEQLFKKDDTTRVNAKNYIGILINNIEQSFKNPNINIVYHIEDSQTLLANMSYPIGLIINEFITNSYKHAFDKSDKGTINVSLNEQNNVYNLELKDNGKGLAKDFNIKELNTFGIETIQLLSEEYNGSFELDGSNGVILNITLPKTAA